MRKTTINGSKNFYSHSENICYENRNHDFYARSKIEKKETVRLVVSVRLSAWNNFATSGQTVTRFYIPVCLENVSRKIQVSLKSDKYRVGQ